MGLVTAIFFLAGTMAGTGVLALASAMVGAGEVMFTVQVTAILFLAGTMAGTLELALASAMVEAGKAIFTVQDPGHDHDHLLSGRHHGRHFGTGTGQCRDGSR
jgi:hypothetical protein